MLKRLVSMLLTVLMFSTLAFGCQPAKKPVPDQDRTIRDDRDPNTNNRNTFPNPVDNNRQTGISANKKAKKLASEAVKVKGVRKAAVVVSGTIAYVGIDLDANFDSKDTELVKEAVADRVENTDKKITRTYVTSDVGLVKRIRNIADDVAKGRPVSGFADELNDIGERIAPDSSRE